MELATFAREGEVHGGAGDINMIVVQRRQAKRAILPGVLDVADADQRIVEQAHHRGQDLLAGQARPGKIARHLLT